MRAIALLRDDASTWSAQSVSVNRYRESGNRREMSREREKEREQSLLREREVGIREEEKTKRESERKWTGKTVRRGSLHPVAKRDDPERIWIRMDGGG